MFCSKCACELPAVAKFCVKCGTPTTPALNRPARGLFCVSCGKPYELSYRFCNYCGEAVPQSRMASPAALAESATQFSNVPSGDVPAPQETSSSPSTAALAESTIQFSNVSASGVHAVQETASVMGSEPKQTLHASYAGFTGYFLGATILTSFAMFTAAYGFGRNSLGDAATGFLVATLIAGISLIAPTRTRWSRIVASESLTDPSLKKRRRRVLVKVAVFVGLFLGTSAVVGGILGQNSAEAAQVSADLIELKTVGSKISKSRTPDNSATIDWYVQMYRSIEPDVNHLDAVLHRLVGEYPSYSSKFPADNSQLDKTISGFNVDIQRMALLKSEIAVAKEIDGQDENEKLVIWKQEMMPLLKREDALDESK